MTADRQSSPLLQRFNGIMFGFFTQMAAFHAARDQWPDLRLQMSHFVSDLGLGVDTEIPERAADFADRRSDVFRSVMNLGDEWSAFKLAFGLGYAFVGAATRAEVMERSHLDGGMSALGLDPSTIDARVENISRDEQERPVFDDLMTEGLKLTAQLIETCAPERETCFVAMPFRAPYPAYYHEVYRVLLEAQGFRCVRAWGGMRNELHHDMLLTLIDHCGWLFAELTDANPNVAYELGFATGRDKPVLAIMDTNPDRWVSWRVSGRPQKLANLRGIAVLPYDSSDPAWREDLLSDAGSRYVSVAQRIQSESDTRRTAGTPGPRGLVARLFGRGGVLHRGRSDERRAEARGRITE